MLSVGFIIRLLHHGEVHGGLAVLYALGQNGAEISGQVKGDLSVIGRLMEVAEVDSQALTILGDNGQLHGRDLRSGDGLGAVTDSDSVGIVLLITGEIELILHRKLGILVEAAAKLQRRGSMCGKPLLGIYAGSADFR